MDDGKRTLYAERVLGLDAEDFFKSDIGRYVLARSEEVSQAATEKLKTITADETNAIRDYQFKIHCAEGAIKWLNDIIRAGKQAMQQLENMQEQEE